MLFSHLPCLRGLQAKIVGLLLLSALILGARARPSLLAPDMHVLQKTASWYNSLLRISHLMHVWHENMSSVAKRETHKPLLFRH